MTVCYNLYTLIIILTAFIYFTGGNNMSLGITMLLSVAVYLILSTGWGLLFKKKALIRLISAGVVAVLSFVITFIIKKTMSDPKTLIDLINTLPAASDMTAKITEMLGMSEALTAVLQSLLSAAVAPMLFIIVFYSLMFLSFILRFIFGLIFKNKNVKIYMGAIYGFAYGLIILFCMLLPFSAYLDVAGAVLPSAKEMQVVDEETFTEIEKPINDLNSSFVFKAHRTLGGKLASNSLTSMKITVGNETTKTTLAPELSAIMYFSNDAIALAKTPMDQYTEKETAAIESLAASLPNSKVLSVTASELIFLATDSWCKGEPFMGIPKPVFNEDFDPLIDKTFQILNADARNVPYLCQDLTTFSKILVKILSLDLSSQTEIAKSLAAEGMVREILSDINENERMRPLIPVITNIGLKMVAEKLGIPENTTAAFNTLTEDISAEIVKNMALDPDARLENMEGALTSSFDKLGITGVSDTEKTILAVSIVNHFNSSSVPSTPADVAAFIGELTSSIEASSGNEPVGADGEYGRVPLASTTSAATEAGKLIADICEIQNDTTLTPDQKGVMIATLFSQSSFNSTVSAEKLTEISGVLATDAANRTGQIATGSLNAVKGLDPNSENTSFELTVDRILVDTTVFDDPTKISKEESGVIIESVANVFDSASTLLSSDLSKSDAPKICEAFGVMLEAFDSNEQFYGKEKTETLLTAVLKSEKMKDTIGFSNEDVDAIISKKNEKDVSYTALMTSVAKTTDILDVIANGGEVTDEQISELVNSLTNEGSGEVISTVITEQRMHKMGFKDGDTPGRVANGALMLRNVFTNVSNIPAGADHDAEVAAVKILVEIAVDAKNNKEAGKNAFGENGRLGCTPGELFDKILASGAVCKTLTETELVGNPFGIKLTVADKFAFIEEYNARVAVSDTETAQTLYKIAILFGVA